jgi:hypothetical protein
VVDLGSNLSFEPLRSPDLFDALPAVGLNQSRENR